MSEALVNSLINVAYVVASALFIFGLKGLAHPRTAVRGNLLGAVGMLLAVLVTLTTQGEYRVMHWGWILAGVILGSAVGVLLAVRIQMTAMPELVAVFNGFGGIASVLVAGAALYQLASPEGAATHLMVATVASGLIGAVTFFGSLVAFGKLQGIISGNAILFPGRHAVNIALGLSAVVLGVMLVLDASHLLLYWALCVAGSLLGIFLVIPIGGADMPVVIALLNSYSGIAAAATGFVLSNNVLIIAGSLVGASGIILTQIMCKAMNRSLANVMFAGVGAESSGGGLKDDEVYAGRIKATSAEEIAMLLDGVRRVVIVPGYGMAVAQAQHSVKTLATLLEGKGVTVEYGIHPVAGRMPGHMNVLLAEADVPYDKLKDMDEINTTFAQTDVAIVIGANDVVNPLARTDPTSPIAGMPILDVDQAKTVIMIKRSLSPGFAGIPNPLFAADNTLMYFADGRQAIQDIIAAIKEAA